MSKFLGKKWGKAWSKAGFSWQIKVTGQIWPAACFVNEILLEYNPDHYLCTVDGFFVLQWQRGDHVTGKALNYLVSDPLKKGLILFLHHVGELETWWGRLGYVLLDAL